MSSQRESRTPRSAPVQARQEGRPAQDARIAGSPAMLAQRRRIASAFGAAQLASPDEELQKKSPQEELQKKAPDEELGRS
jgi:hypothetical protein